MPLVLGKQALGPFRWANSAHGARLDAAWSAGSGIGVPELFVGLDDNVCMFGIHAESRGCDFVNILTDESDPGVCVCARTCVSFACSVPCVHFELRIACICSCLPSMRKLLIVADAVHWKFIPINPHNNIKMSLLQACVDPEHMRTFYKGAMLSDETLRRFGFADFTEVIQQPGEAVTAHSYHCGLGMQKIAEAHSWFSEAWYGLRLDNAPELPVFFPGEVAEAASDAQVLLPTMASASAAPGGSAARKRRKITTSDDEPGAAS